MAGPPPGPEPRAPDAGEGLFAAPLPSAVYGLQLPAILAGLAGCLPPVCRAAAFGRYAAAFGALNRAVVCGALSREGAGPGRPALRLEDPEFFSSGPARCTGLALYCPTYLRRAAGRRAPRDPLLRAAFPFRGKVPRVPAGEGPELHAEYLVIPLLAFDAEAPRPEPRLRALLYQCLVQAEHKGLPLLVHRDAVSPGALPLLRALGFRPLAAGRAPAAGSRAAEDDPLVEARADGEPDPGCPPGDWLALWPGRLAPPLSQIEDEFLGLADAGALLAAVLPPRDRQGCVYRAVQIDRPLERAAAAAFLAQAFADDPLKLLMQRRPDAREGHVLALTDCVMRGTARAGGNWLFLRRDPPRLLTEPEAVLLTSPADMGSGRWGNPLAFGLAWIRFGARLSDLPSAAAFDRCHLAHCGDPRDHVYVAYISAHPLRRGAGLGAAMMRRVGELADLSDSFVYLENSKERNLAFYQKSGLRVAAPFAFEDARSGERCIGYAMRRPRRSEGEGGPGPREGPEPPGWPETVESGGACPGGAGGPPAPPGAPGAEPGEPAPPRPRYLLRTHGRA